MSARGRGRVLVRFAFGAYCGLGCGLCCGAAHQVHAAVFAGAARGAAGDSPATLKTAAARPTTVETSTRAPATVLLLGPVDAEWMTRLSAYVSRSEWVLLPSEAVVGDAHAALEYARAQRATAVVWLHSDDTHVEVQLLDVQRRQSLHRTIALSGNDVTLARSTAFEAAALIVGAALERIRDGQTLGETIEPEPTVDVGARNGTATVVHPGPASTPRVEASRSPALALSLGAQTLSDNARWRVGPSLGVSGRYAGWWLEMNVEWWLPSRVDASALPAAGAERSELQLQLWEAGAALLLGRELSLSEGVRLQVGLGSGVLWAYRDIRSVSDDLLATSGKGEVLVPVVLRVRLLSPLLATWAANAVQMRVALDGQVVALLSKPKWVVAQGDGAGDLPIEPQWALLQPGVALKMCFEFQ